MAEEKPLQQPTPAEDGDKKKSKPKRRYHVPEGYRGRATREVYIPEGTWFEDSPELQGLGDTLVNLGKASQI